MNAKEYLSQAYRIDQRINSKLEQVMSLRALLGKATGTLTDPIFYISGPPPMVAAMRETLEDAGVDEDNVRSEEFYGY